MKLKHITLLLLAILLLFLRYLNYKSPFIKNLVSLKRTNFIILGVDLVDYAVHSDVILLLSYSPRNKIIDIISVPRDSYVDVPGLKYKKLTEVFAFLYKQAKRNNFIAAKKFTEILSTTIFSSPLGEIDLPYFIVLDYTGFKKIIDSLGKVKIYVYEPMRYEDKAGNLYIHFEPGEYLMSGEEVLKYVRYRDKKGDFGRISRQQQFIKSIIKTFANPVTLFKTPLLIIQLKQSVTTNINLWEFFNLLIEFRDLKLVNMRFSCLQGTFQGRYIKLNKENIIALIKYLNTDTNLPDNAKKIKCVKVYNATETRGLAKKVTNVLRDKGYDVIDLGDWYYNLPKSRIIDYSGDVKLVNDVAKLLCITDITTIYSSRMQNYTENYGSERQNEFTYSDSDVDLVIILGNDCNLLSEIVK